MFGYFCVRKKCRPHAQQRRHAVGENHAFVLTAETPVAVGLTRVRLLAASNTQRWGEHPQHPPQGVSPRAGRGNTGRSFNMAMHCVFANSKLMQQLDRGYNCRFCYICCRRARKTHTYTKICAFAKVILLCTTTYFVQNSGQNRVARQPTK